jgi:hypothetical protein
MTTRPPRWALPVAAVLLSGLAAPLALAADPAGSAPPAAAAQVPGTMTRTVRIAFLHHSTGGNVWKGGVPEFFQGWNAAHGTDYRITDLTYPASTGGWPWIMRRLVTHYPWENYPYDYWNLWVAHTGASRDRKELNLDDIARDYDVIVFKHCYPVSGIEPDDGAPSVSSRKKTLANYRLQYQALRERLAQVPDRKFIVWTGPALTAAATNPEQSQRARAWADWVRSSWDRPGDNVFLWDFYALETRGGLVLPDADATSPTDPHPNPALARRVAPLLGQRIVDVIEGRGDTASLTGEAPAGGDRAVSARE